MPHDNFVEGYIYITHAEQNIAVGCCEYSLTRERFADGDV